MTDEERQQLCAWLRTLKHPTILKTADEIERLAAENKRLQNELRLWKEQG